MMSIHYRSRGCGVILLICGLATMIHPTHGIKCYMCIGSGQPQERAGLIIGPIVGGDKKGGGYCNLVPQVDWIQMDCPTKLCMKEIIGEKGSSGAIFSRKCDQQKDPNAKPGPCKTEPPPIAGMDPITTCYCDQDLCNAGDFYSSGGLPAEESGNNENGENSENNEQGRPPGSDGEGMSGASSIGGSLMLIALSCAAIIMS